MQRRYFILDVGMSCLLVSFKCFILLLLNSNIWFVIIFFLVFKLLFVKYNQGPERPSGVV